MKWVVGESHTHHPLLKFERVNKMKVTLNSPQNLGNVEYPKGAQELPDSLYANIKFQGLVRSGAIVVHPRDEATQKAQASKDLRAQAKAVSAEEDHKAAVEARKELKNNKVFNEPASLKSVEEAQALLPSAAPATQPPAATESAPAPAKAIGGKKS